MNGIRALLPRYCPREEELVALRGLLKSNVRGARALLILGQPGIGKSYLAECLTKGMQIPLVKYSCHSWSSDQELFMGINIPAAVSGDADNVNQEGRLLVAARKSKEGKVLLLIDELDKAPDSIDNLLLEFLQEGIVPLGDGTYVQGNLDNMLVFITSNECRQVHPAFKRRCRRLHMRQLPADVLDELISEQADISPKLARKLRVVCQQAASKDEETSSLQEMVNLAEELKLAISKNEVLISLRGWASRGEKGNTFLTSDKVGKDLISEIWSLI